MSHIRVKCDFCSNPAWKSTSQIMKTNHNFCSRSCAAKFNNRIPKRKIRLLVCINCASEFSRRGQHYSRLYCENCIGTRGKDKAKEITLGELYSRLKHLNGKHPSWVNAVVRQYNRTWNKTLLMLPCAACNYSRHVELAHIKPITSFPLTAKLGEINARENNIQLCPNCHWELDHGIILISALVPALSPKQVTVMDDAGSIPAESTIIHQVPPLLP